MTAIKNEIIEPEYKWVKGLITKPYPSTSHSNIQKLEKKDWWGEIILIIQIYQIIVIGAPRTLNISMYSLWNEFMAPIFSFKYGKISSKDTTSTSNSLTTLVVENNL